MTRKSAGERPYLKFDFEDEPPCMQEVNSPIAENSVQTESVAPVSLARDETGQVSVLVVLSIIPFVLLLAFIFNSAKQTSSKIELQGAADSAAVASAVTSARGMNFMVLNNNAMAEVLSLMIAVRCIKNTARIMEIYLGIRALITCTAAAACSIFCAPLIEECAELTAAAIRWAHEASRWSTIDEYLNNDSGGLGWRVLRLLDGLNSVSKIAFAIWAGLQARTYAQKNGANYDPLYGFVLGGKSGANFGGISVPLPIPTFPVARGPEQATAFRLEECQYKFFGKLNGLVSLYIAAIDPKRAAESVGLYQVLRWANINHLKGDWGFIGEIFDEILGQLPGALVGFIGRIADTLGQFLGIQMLDWPGNPPKPMLLTDHPENSTTDEREVDDDAKANLRPYLQHLGIALRRVPTGSPIGGDLFLNKPNAVGQVQFTYAQADVYNPTRWDMWTQDWRAQLMRAKLFDQKINELLSVLPFLQGGLDWSFVNTH